MFLAGRFLTGLGCTTAAAAAKSYVSDRPCVVFIESSH